MSQDNFITEMGWGEAAYLGVVLGLCVFYVS